MLLPLSVLTLWSAITIYRLYILASDSGCSCLSNLARPSVEIFVHFELKVEAVTRDGFGESYARFSIKVRGVLWLGDDEIAEDQRLHNAEVIAEIGNHNNDSSQKILALTPPSVFGLL